MPCQSPINKPWTNAIIIIIDINININVNINMMEVTFITSTSIS